MILFILLMALVFSHLLISLFWFACVVWAIWHNDGR